MDKTTTTDDITPTGAESALPAAGAEVAAETTETTAPAEQSTDVKPAEASNEGGEEPLPTTDEKLASFAKGQGIEDISELSEREKSLLKAAYDNKAAADRNFQRSNELEKATKITEDQVPADATPQQAESVRLRNLELRSDIQAWKLSNPDKLALEADMVKVLADQTKRALVQEGYLSLDDVYVMAKGAAPSDEAKLKSEGKREALESLAHKQQAAVPTGHATNSSVTSSSKITPQNVNQMVAAMTPEEYRRRMPEINAALSGR